MSNGVSRIVDANPLGSGSSPNSVESAAAGFDALFPDTEPTGVNRDEEEDNPRPRPSEPPADAPKGKKARAPDPDGDDDGHAPEALFEDPILGSEPPREGDDGEEGDEDDDEGDTDEGDDEGDEDGDDEDLDLDRKVTVTVNGEEVEIPLKEALAGYQRDADYRQKTAQVAEERREVEEYAQEVVAERKHYAETLQEFVSLAESLKPSKEELDSLKTSNPQLYITVREQWEAVEKKLGEAKAEQAKISEREAQEAERQYTNWVRSENQKLAQAVPALANPKKAKAFRDAIFRYGKAAGYSEKELMTGAVDHRDVLTLYKASRYDEIMRSRQTGQRKKTPKASAEAAASGAPRNVSRRTSPEARKAQREAERRLARSGSVDDAAAAFTAMIQRGG